jgi:hypothetical protein
MLLLLMGGHGYDAALLQARRRGSGDRTGVNERRPAVTAEACRQT